MPVPADSIMGALDVVDEVFAENHGNPTWHLEVQRRFEKILSNSDQSLQSLESASPVSLKDGQLVRFRGMIQDMFDPEFYYDSYDATSSDGRKIRRSGRFRDVAQGPCDVNMTSPLTRTMDRMSFYCISVPAESPWAKKARLPTSSDLPTRTPAHTSTEDLPQSAKRPLDDDMPSASAEEESNKRLRPDSATVPTNVNPIDRNRVLNFPVPDESGIGCIVKVYDESDNYSINDIVEFTGILSIDPALTVLVQGQNDLETDEPMDKIENAFEEEQAARNPPPSFIPRLHVIFAQKVTHSNPLLRSDLTGAAALSAHQNILSTAKELRNELKSILTEAMLGDSLAAEYLICHLLSSVYIRRDVMAVGKFCVNFSNIPSSCTNFVSGIFRLIQHLVPKAHLLPLSLENLNGLPFVPRKDYNMNRLVSGVLQLSEQTHLALDETAMSSGTLDANGIKNVASLANVISWQKIAYDFHYHQLEYNTNIAVLIFSEGKSLLPSDALVPLEPEPGKVEGYEAMQSAIFTFLSEDLANRLRCYLTIAKFIDYSLTEELQTAIQEEFVASRHNEGSATPMSADDLHAVLSLARLLSISYGEATLTREVWDLARRMEEERKRRLVPVLRS